MWNTGCNNIANLLDHTLNIVNGEANWQAITILPKRHKDFRSVIFPWCDNIEEVKNKAFRVVNIKSGKTFMYLFQEYRTNKICWLLKEKNQPLDFDKKCYVQSGSDESSPALPPYSAIDIYIFPTHVFGIATQSENIVAQTILKEMTKIAEDLIGEIAKAALAA